MKASIRRNPERVPISVKGPIRSQCGTTLRHPAKVSKVQQQAKTGRLPVDVVVFSKSDEFSQRAIQIARVAFGGQLVCFSGKFGDPFPEDVGPIKADIILSFLCPWVLPKSILEKAAIALNWHPASTDYPGIGCYNFALYHGVTEYGATCHYMAEKVDTGGVVEERRFPVFDSDTVETLKLRTMVTMTSMFHDTVCRLASGWKPPLCGASWSRRPFTRREFNELSVIDATMSADEVKRRIRATTYPGYPGPHVVVGGEKFILPIPDRKPLA
jgi:methionyl-tRNA formyltransferase